MTTVIDELSALATLRLDWADTPDHVWQDSPYHVDGPHADALQAIDVEIRDATASAGPSPIGLVLQGQKGIGKTHLLGLARREIHRVDGYFFLDDLTSGEAFWENTAAALRTGLLYPDQSGDPQLVSFLRRACRLGGVDPRVSEAIVTGRGVTVEDVDAFVDGLRTIDGQVAKECADTARTLVLYASKDPGVQYLVNTYLEGFPESTAGERSAWRLRPAPKPASAQVKEISRLLALTGPIVIAVDQIDTLIAESRERVDSTGADNAVDFLVGHIADGLMRLREVTRRTVTLLACLPLTWTQIKNKAADTVPDRFRESVVLGRVADGEIGRALVAKRLGVTYAALGFDPPYPTWPIAPSAFEGEWEEYTPRELLKRVFAHVDSCVRGGEARELTSFDDRPTGTPDPAVKPDRFAELDAMFEEFLSTATIAGLPSQEDEDEVMPELLSAALQAWISEVGDDDMAWEYGTTSNNGALHAWLRHTVDEQSDLVEHWAFRAIAASHPNAALSRFRKARDAAKWREDNDSRHLAIIRRQRWSNGRMTRSLIGRFEQAGGRTVDITDEDVRKFWALKQMLATGGSWPGRRVCCPACCRASTIVGRRWTPESPWVPTSRPAKQCGSTWRRCASTWSCSPDRDRGKRYCCGASSRSARCAVCPRSCWTRTTTWRASVTPGRRHHRHGSRGMPNWPTDIWPTRT
jgi:hypothetical protein